MPLNDYIRGLKRMASKKGKTSLPKKMKTGFDDGSDLATVAPTGAAPSPSVTAPISTAPTGAAPTGAISTRLAPIQAPQRTKILTAAPAHTSCSSKSTNAENNVTRPELKRVRKKTLEVSPKRKNTLRDRSNVISPKPKRATRKLLNPDREGTARDHTDQEGTARDHTDRKGTAWNQNQVPSKPGKKVATRSSGIAKDGLKRNSSKIMPDKTKKICVVERLDESPEELTVEMLVTSETRTLPDVVTTDMLTTSTLDQLSNVNLSTSKFDAGDLSTSKLDDDPFCLTYADDIVRYWLTLEKRFSLSSDFLDDNPEVDYTSRATLIDWLIQVQDHLGLLAETLHLCVSMIDRYLSTKTIRIYHIQLLGITCLFIACKYEERSPPPIKHLIYLTDNTYAYDEVIAMEVKILRVLAFQVFAPTAINFVPWLIRSVVVQGAETISKKIESIVHYILDLTTSDGAFTSILPSIRASAAVALGGKLFFEAHMPTVCSRMKLLNIKVSLEQYENLFNFHAGSWRNISSYDIEPCMSRMARLLLRAPQSALQGARKKYSSVEQHDAISMDPIFTTSEILRQLSSQYS